MKRQVRRVPLPLFSRLLERRELMLMLAALPDVQEQQAVLKMCIESLDRQIRERLQTEPELMKELRQPKARPAAQLSEQDVLCFQPVSKRPSWLKSQF